MSTSNTLRFYVNDKRVSTAVRVKDCYILQVYPMRQRFANEEDWRSYWEMNRVCKPTIRVTGSIPLESTQTKATKEKGFRCSVCLLDGSFDHRNCIVLKFKGNIADWETSCQKKKAPSPKKKTKPTPVAPTPSPAPAPAPEPAPAPAPRHAPPPSVPRPNRVAPWYCCICHLPPGNDHRMCIAQGFRWSRTPIQDWERASGVTRNEEEEEPKPLQMDSSSVISYDEKDWTHTYKNKQVFPPGKYYIGDLCYVLSDKIYNRIFGGNEYDDGVYIQKGGKYFFMVAGTSCGDGAYQGSDGREFCVDAGIIGICPQSLVEKGEGEEPLYEFTEPVECFFKDGEFNFVSPSKSLTIYT